MIYIGVSVEGLCFQQSWSVFIPGTDKESRHEKQKKLFFFEKTITNILEEYIFFFRLDMNSHQCCLFQAKY